MKTRQTFIGFILLFLFAFQVAGQENRTLYFTKELKADMSQVKYEKVFKGGDPIYGLLVINKTENSSLENVRPFSSVNDQGTRGMIIEMSYGELDQSFDGQYAWPVNTTDQRLANPYFAFTLVPAQITNPNAQMPRQLLKILQNRVGKKTNIAIAIEGRGNEQNMAVNAAFTIDLTNGMGSWAEMWKPYAEQEAKDAVAASAVQKQNDEQAAATAAQAKIDEVAAEAKVPMPTAKMNDPKLEAEIKQVIQDFLGKDNLVYKVVIGENDWHYNKNEFGILLNRTLWFWTANKDLKTGDCMLTNRYYVREEHISAGTFSKPRINSEPYGKHEWYQPCAKISGGK